MRKLALLIGIISLSFSNVTFAQTEQAKPKEEADKKDDKVDKLKVAYFTAELNLTQVESDKFWPLYNECEAKMKELRKSSRTIQKSIDENFATMSNEDAKNKMNEIFANEAKEVSLKKDYAVKFSAIIGDKRALKLLSLEHEFKKELLNALKDEGPGHHGPPHPRPNDGK